MADVALDNNAAPMDEQRHLVSRPNAGVHRRCAEGVVPTGDGDFPASAKGQMGTAAGFQWAMDQNCRRTWSGHARASGRGGRRPDGRTSLTTTGWTTVAQEGDVFAMAPARPASTWSTAVPAVDRRPPAVRRHGGHHGHRRRNRHPIAPGIVTAVFRRSWRHPQRRGDQRPQDHRAPAHRASRSSRRVHARHGRPARAKGHRHGVARLGQAAGHLAPHVALRHHHGQFPCRIGILYGWATLRPELACRVWAA